MLLSAYLSLVTSLNIINLFYRFIIRACDRGDKENTKIQIQIRENRKIRIGVENFGLFR